eukprot:12404229-Karenia_brevis.AAC.1
MDHRADVADLCDEAPAPSPIAKTIQTPAGYSTDEVDLCHETYMDHRADRVDFCDDAPATSPIPKTIRGPA